MTDDFGRIPALARTFSPHSQLLESIAQRILDAARKFAPNAHVRESISADQVEDQGKNRIIITLKATAPDARAYEYGSGIHSRRSNQSPRQLGPKGKIEITPRNAPYLVFPWDGKIIKTLRVEHPGVNPANQGEGYLRKAVKETKKENKAELAQGISRAVKSDIIGRFKFRLTK